MERQTPLREVDQASLGRGVDGRRLEDVAVRRAPVVLGLQEERACTDHAQRKLADELARRVGSNEGPRDELGDRDERAAGERPFVLSKVERTVSRERIL